MFAKILFNAAIARPSDTGLCALHQYASRACAIASKPVVAVTNGGKDNVRFGSTNAVCAKKFTCASGDFVPVSSSLDEDWITITVTGDKDTGRIKMFLNGVYIQDKTVSTGTRLTNVKADEEASSYAFCIGGQCDVRGGSVDPLIGAVCDYREVAVYDCKLSDQNVKELYDGNRAVISKQEEGNNDYVTEVQPVDASAIDLDITDKNTVNGVIRESLGSKKVKVNTTAGSRSYNTIWYPAADGQTIKGKVLVDNAINVDNTQASLTYKYVCKLDYDPNKVTVSEVQLDNAAYEFGGAISSARHTVSFVLTPKEGVTIEAVSFNEMDWDPEEDGEVPAGSFLYYITFLKGAHISVETSGGSSQGGEEGEQPAPDQGGEQAPAKKGCGSSIIATSAILSITAALGAGLLLLKKKEK